jgi:hypothetical protein
MLTLGVEGKKMNEGFTKGQMALIDAGFGMAGDGLWIDPDTGEIMSFRQATAQVNQMVASDIVIYE